MSKADQEMIKLFAARTKCIQCKHRFDKPIILPVENPTRGVFQPNYNMEVVFHMQDTHGILNNTFMEWIVGSVYGQQLGDFGIRSGEELAGIYTRERKKLTPKRISK